jgi:hypothetical protein
VRVCRSVYRVAGYRRPACVTTSMLRLGGASTKSVMRGTTPTCTRAARRRRTGSSPRGFLREAAPRELDGKIDGPTGVVAARLNVSLPVNQRKPNSLSVWCPVLTQRAGQASRIGCKSLFHGHAITLFHRQLLNPKWQGLSKR